MHDLNLYLNEGPQTKITDLTKEISVIFESRDLDLIFEILGWIKKNLKKKELGREKIDLFRKRTAEEIIKSGFLTGCTDYALAFIVLARACHIPTKYVEAIRNKWLDIGTEEYLEGHVFAECFINNKWYIIDPEEGDIKSSYGRFQIYAKDLDSWSLGIKNFDDLKVKFLEFRKNYKKTN